MSGAAPRTLRILGTRGLPAAHGGFETFAQHLALYLVQRGWRVVVYGQSDGDGPWVRDVWQGVERVTIPVRWSGAKGTVVFDALAVRDAARYRDPCLVLGYNTAVFGAWLRLRGVRQVINMDGIEWSRAKWGPVAKAWLWANDWAGCWLGDALVADHPEIARHLATRTRTAKITTIPYGADALAPQAVEPVESLGLEPGRYLSVIARPEPENSLLEIVSGFSQAPRGAVLAVLGHYRQDHPYHQAVRAAAGPEVRFLGAIYDPRVVQALRWHSLAYVHGHQVGGTNPSLVEAMGAGNAVLAHDNRFNRWVAAEGALYFSDANQFAQRCAALLADPTVREGLAQGSRKRHCQVFTWNQVLGAYEDLLLKK